MNRSMGEQLRFPALLPKAKRIGAAFFCSLGVAGFNAASVLANDQNHLDPVPYLPNHTGMKPHETPGPVPASAGQAQETNLMQPFSADEKKFLQRQVVYMYGLRCSGALIESSTEVPEGALTADHCGLRDDFSVNPNYSYYYGTWIKGANNQEYIVEPEGIIAETGSDQALLRPAGYVSELILPSDGSANNLTIDQAIAVFGNNDPKTVLQDYRNEMMTRAEIREMKPGKTKVNLGGWPVNQNGDSYGNMVRQNLKTTYIGETVATPTSGEQLNVIATAVKTDANGATCSPGASGSEGFVNKTVKMLNGVKKHVMKSVGDLAVYWPFTPNDGFDQATVDIFKNYFKSQFPKFNWKGVAAVCGFAPKLYNNNDYTIVKVAPDVESIPDPVVSSPQSAAELLQYSTTAKFKVFPGEVVVNTPGKGGPVPTIIENPVVYTEPGQTAIIAADALLPSGSDAGIYPNSELTFYTPDKPRLINTVSKGINYKYNAPSGSFEDASGWNFGVLTTAPDPNAGQAYKIKLIHGKPVFKAVLK